MPKKNPSRHKLLVGDVLRWTEPDWHAKGKRKKTFFKKGERRVTAPDPDDGPRFCRFTDRSLAEKRQNSKGVLSLPLDKIQVLNIFPFLRTQKAGTAP
jgi:hypothetical protein